MTYDPTNTDFGHTGCSPLGQTFILFFIAKFLEIPRFSTNFLNFLFNLCSKVNVSGMAAESLWKVRPAARNFQTDPNRSVPAVQHPLEEIEVNTQLGHFWAKRKQKVDRKPELEQYDFEDPLGKNSI